MKSVVLYVKKVLALLVCLFFTVIAFDWIVLKGGSFLLGRHHDGLFFQEVWSVTQNIFTWVGEGIVRDFMWVLAIIVTVFIPISLACLTCFYYLWCDFLLKDMGE